jgi:ATP-dependent HslUV protease ATP-binding subunit HslU
VCSASPRTVSFEAADRTGEKVTVGAAYVDEHLADLVGDEDLARYIL